jgi:hypothetical protein
MHTYLFARACMVLAITLIDAFRSKRKKISLKYGYIARRRKCFTALPNAVLLYADVWLLCRLLPPPALRKNFTLQMHLEMATSLHVIFIGCIMRPKTATSLPCEIF